MLKSRVLGLVAAAVTITWAIGLTGLSAAAAFAHNAPSYDPTPRAF
jgi:hypothetical protein